MSEYHEADGDLSSETRDFHRALRSLQEELEAVDWYQQRWEASTDSTLRGIIAHNRDEEMEHACMLLEWLRRTMPGWDRNLRKYLFQEGSSIAEKADAPHPVGALASAGAGDLRIRSVRRLR